jgi:mannose-6-phosphate isomerase
MASPYGEPGVGIAALPDGTALPDAVAADPDGYFGPHHVERFGSDVGVLIKLLDAGERLPVHLHPDDDFARAHLGSPCGKTEAWIILAAEPGAAVQVGFRDPVSRATLAGWVESQDAEAMLASLHRVAVSPGDTIFVPASTPHAIGAGILLAELQQPTDLSLLLEWEGFADDVKAAFLGLEPEVALEAVNLEPWSEANLAWARSGRPSDRASGETLFPAEADPFFRCERVAVGARFEPEFAVFLVIEGNGTLRGDDWKLDVAAGNAILMPHAAGPHVIEGSVEALRCMPPDPSTSQ